MKAVERNVTPELAALWLKNNTLNRPVRGELVNTYAKDMIGGNWSSNGETIKLSMTGKLLDGQHRLMAVIQSKTTQKMLIVDGLPEASFRTIDVGMRRTAGQLFGISGIANSRSCSAIARWVRILESGKGYGKTVTPPELFETMERHPLIHKYASKVSSDKKLRSLTSMPVVSVFVLGAEKYGEPLIDSFLEMLSGGEGISKGDPAFELRERLIQNMTHISKLQTETIIAFAIKAMTAFCNGRKIGILRVLAAEQFPEI